MILLGFAGAVAGAYLVLRSRLLGPPWGSRVACLLVAVIIASSTFALFASLGRR